MILKLQKRLAGSVLRCSPKRVIFDPARLEDIKEAITKTDIRMLVGEGAISERPVTGVSRFRANKRKVQRSKGLRKGAGSRKGKATARRPGKQAWMDRVRVQRKFLKKLKITSLINNESFKELYAKSKGGYFRSIKHIKLFINEHNMVARAAKQEMHAQQGAKSAEPKGKDAAKQKKPVQDAAK